MERPLVARTVREIGQFARVSVCPRCRGRWTIARDSPAPLGREIEGPDAGGAIVVVCGGCGLRREVTVLTFSAAARPEASSVQDPGSQPGSGPSRLIDLAQWLTLYRLHLDDSDRATDKKDRRRMLMEAGDCLREALRFYVDQTNDLPPVSAFFDVESVDRFRSHPEQFSRKRLIELKARLPSAGKGS